MNGKVLLDTNIVVALINGDPSVRSFAARTEDVFLPCIVIGELFYGAFRSARAKENVAHIEAFAAERSILACDTNTARYFGEIKNQLRIKGRPIPDNDLWIAAIAVQHGLTLISRDDHFREIERLSLESLTP
jgi:tRNA(fMet)-specific endonuclease VapC